MQIFRSYHWSTKMQNIHFEFPFLWPSLVGPKKSAFLRAVDIQCILAVNPMDSDLMWQLGKGKSLCIPWEERNTEQAIATRLQHLSSHFNSPPGPLLLAETKEKKSVGQQCARNNNGGQQPTASGSTVVCVAIKKAIEEISEMSLAPLWRSRAG